MHAPTLDTCSLSTLESVSPLHAALLLATAPSAVFLARSIYEVARRTSVGRRRTSGASTKRRRTTASRRGAQAP